MLCEMPSKFVSYYSIALMAKRIRWTVCLHSQVAVGRQKSDFSSIAEDVESGKKTKSAGTKKYL